MLISHYSNTSGILGRSLGKGAGQVGIMIFFALSGFLMSYLYLNKECNLREVKKYFISRLARVVPLFLIIVIISFLFQMTGILTKIVYKIKSPGDLVSHLLFLKGTHILWTIPVEIHFYIFFSLIWWISSRFNKSIITICALIIFVVIFFGFPEYKKQIYTLSIDFQLIKSLPYFLIGVVSGWLYNKEFQKSIIKSNWFMIILLVIPLLYPQIHQRIFALEYPLWEGFGIFYEVATIFIVYIFLIPDNWMIVSRLGDFLGKISYSLYLLHIPILLLLRPYIKENPFVMLVVFLLLTIAVSTISYYIIEAPSRKLIRSWK